MVLASAFREVLAVGVVSPNGVMRIKALGADPDPDPDPALEGVGQGLELSLLSDNRNEVDDQCFPCVRDRESCIVRVGPL